MSTARRICTYLYRRYMSNDCTIYILMYVDVILWILARCPYSRISCHAYIDGHELLSRECLRDYEADTVLKWSTSTWHLSLLSVPLDQLLPCDIRRSNPSLSLPPHFLRNRSGRGEYEYYTGRRRWAHIRRRTKHRR